VTAPGGKRRYIPGRPEPDPDSLKKERKKERKKETSFLVIILP